MREIRKLGNRLSPFNSWFPGFTYAKAMFGIKWSVRFLLTLRFHDFSMFLFIYCSKFMNLFLVV